MMRSYVRADAAWYARANGYTVPRFNLQGDTGGEFQIRQEDAIGLLLEIFGDGCALFLAEYQDLVAWLADNENASGDELEAWLRASGVEDRTPRQKPGAPDEDSDRGHAYRVFKPSCGCVDCLLVDCPEMRETNAGKIAAAIRDGWSVDRVTVKEARTSGPLRCAEHTPEEAFTREPTETT